MELIVFNLLETHYYIRPALEPTTGQNCKVMCHRRLPPVSPVVSYLAFGSETSDPTDHESCLSDVKSLRCSLFPARRPSLRALFAGMDEYVNCSTNFIDFISLSSVNGLTMRRPDNLGPRLAWVRVSDSRSGLIRLGVPHAPTSI